MTGRKLISDTFNLKETTRTPWVPFVGIHGARLTGTDAGEYLHSSRNMINGLSKAIELYRPDGIPALFDLQLEAEAIGCKLKWSTNSPPAVISHPLTENISIADLRVPEANCGRIHEVMKTVKCLRKRHQDTALYGLVTGPFTLGLHLLGTDIFYKMMAEPGFIHSLMEYTSTITCKMSEYYMDQGCDIIAVADPMTSQIDPDSFHSFVSPYVTVIFDQIKAGHAFSSFFVCGHAQQNIEEMCKCHPDNISIDENIPLEYMREYAEKYRISFGGNLKLTMVLLLGTREEVQQEALQCMDLGGEKGFILSPGCDLPIDTPVENLQVIADLIHDPYSRDVIRAMKKRAKGVELMDMKDYGLDEKVIIDIITLDSESCAPCQYMVEAVKKVTPHFDGIVEWREHPIKNMEGISFMSSLMVKNIPTICIDGKITFVSKIPPKQELIAAIQQRINEKLRLKIKSRKGEIIILGKNDGECEKVLNNIRKAIEETGKNLDIKKSTDPDQMATFGVCRPPAVVIAEYKLKSEGKIPEIEIVKEWIKDI